MNNKKLLKLSLVLCASILMAVSCAKKEPTTPELPSVGSLQQNSGVSLPNLSSSTATGDEVSGAGKVTGFNTDFKSAVKNKDNDIKYTIKTVQVLSVTESGGTTVEVQKAIKNGALVAQVGTTFDEIKIGFAQTSDATAEKNARDIATAIKSGKTAAILLTVEASPAGNTSGKFSSSTFEVRFSITAS